VVTAFSAGSARNIKRQFRPGTTFGGSGGHTRFTSGSSSRNKVLVDEALLNQLAQAADKPSLAKNAWREIEAFKYLPAAAMLGYTKARKEGVGTAAKEMLYEPLKEYYRGYRHPLKHAYENPIGTTFDALTLLTLGGSSVLNAAQFAGIPAKSLSPLSKVVRVAGAVERAGSPAAWVGAGSKALKGRYVEALGKGLTRAEMGIPARVGESLFKFGAKADTYKQLAKGKLGLKRGGYADAANALKQSNIEQISKTMTPDELMIEDFYSSVPMPQLKKYFPEAIKQFESSPKAKALHEAHKGLEDVYLKNAKEYGHLTDETIARYKTESKYRPYAMELAAKDIIDQEVEKIKNKIVEMEAKGAPGGTLEAMEEQITELLKPDYGNKDMMLRRAKKIDRVDFNDLVDSKIKFLMSEGESPNLVYRWKGAKTDPTVMHMGRLSERSPLPYTKGVMDVANRTIDPARGAMTRLMIDEKSKYIRQTFDGMIGEGVRNGWAKPYQLNMEIPQGWRIISPTFLFKAYKNTIRALDHIPQDEYAKIISHVQANKDALPGDLIKAVAEYSKPGIAEGLKEAITESKMGLQSALKNVEAYIVPEDVARIIENKVGAESSRLLRTVFDTPTQLWREFVLSLSPRWMIYNTVGNLAFGLLQGMGPRDLLKGNVGKFSEKMPMEVAEGLMSETNLTQTTKGAVSSLLSRPEKYVELKSPSGNLVRVYQPKLDLLGKGWEVGKTGAQYAGKGLGVIKLMNEKVENFFRRGAFHKEVSRMAKAELRDQGVGGFLNNKLVEEKMMDIINDPVKSAKALDEMGKWFFHYHRSTPFQTGVMRRIFPFWSWYKNMAKMTFWTLPAEHPAKFKVLQLMATVGKEAWNDTIREKGIDPNLMPEWLRQAVPVGYDPITKEFEFMNTMGVNPFTTMSELSFKQMLASTNPMIKIAVEQALKEDVFREKKYESMFVVKDPTGRLWEYDKDGRMKPSTGRAPHLLEHAARQLPHYQLLKNYMLARKYGKVPSEYAESSVFNLQPILDTEKGKPAVKFGAPLSRKFLGLAGWSTVRAQARPEFQGKMEKAAKTNLYKRLQRQAQEE
jgi:hypothetical protein